VCTSLSCAAASGNKPHQVGHQRVLQTDSPASCWVFLREAERQRLQTLLHQEVLRRIVMLQRHFRAVLERRHFVSIRQAARVIQAAVVIQTAWRRVREKNRFCTARSSVTQLQAMGQGYLARVRFKRLKEQRETLSTWAPRPGTEMDAGNLEDFVSSGLDSSVGVDSSEETDLTKTERGEDSERSRYIDETSHKNRSKRESRRMRELEQAQFSLELLKVRTTSMGGSLPEDVVTDSSLAQVDDHHHRLSPQGSPTSHGSFEMLSVDEMETEGSGRFASQLTGSREQPQTLEILTDSNHNEKPVKELSTKSEEPRATFYIASDQSPVNRPNPGSLGRTHKDRKESVSRRPVVVLISMQKESPVEERELLAAHALEGASQTGSFGSSMTPNEDIRQATHKGQPSELFPQAKRNVVLVEKVSKLPTPKLRGENPEEPALCSSKVDIQIGPQPKSSVSTVLPGKQASPILDTKPPKAQKKSSAQTVIVNMVEKPSSTVFSPPRRKLPFSK
ncbi:hypothetical protein XENOCAPTIV_020863, partial [Xenoophorus captivus]